MCKHTLDPLHWGLVHSLGQPVKLWHLWHSILEPDTLWSIVFFELSSVFTVVIHSHCFQFFVGFSLGSHLELFENTSYLILRLQHVSPKLTIVIINEDNKVLSTRMRLCIYIAFISVYEFQGGFPPNQRPWSERNSVLFADQAISTLVEMHFLHCWETNSTFCA